MIAILLVSSIGQKKNGKLYEIINIVLKGSVPISGTVSPANQSVSPLVV